MSKRYKVKRFNSCYSMNWVDNKTNKELTALEVEEILHKQEKRIAELEEFLHNREKWIAELEKQVNLSRAMERVALKGCKELEEQLANSIRPKFKIGQEVYTIRHNNSIYHTRIDEIKIVGINGKNEIFYYYDQPGSYAHWEELEDNLFATKEEAQEKLRELQGE